MSDRPQPKNVATFLRCYDRCKILGAGLAIASLTLQLIDGVDRFQNFFEECRHPTINVQDLIGQLKSLQLLLYILEREATKPGVGDGLADTTSLQDELCRSKSRLQELTNLVTNFEAGSRPTSPDRNGGKVRIKNYFKLHLQQKKIRRYTENLARTRTGIIDHFHITIMSQVSDLHADRVQEKEENPEQHQYNSTGASGFEKQLVAYQSHSQDRAAMRDSTAPTTPSQAPHPAARNGSDLSISHDTGAAVFNLDNNHSVKNTQCGTNARMFAQSFGRKTDQPSQPNPVPQQLQQVGIEQPRREPASREDIPSPRTRTDGQPATVRFSGSAENTCVNKGNAMTVDSTGGNTTMFEQNMN